MNVCAACFEDKDIVARIRAYGDEPGCDFCGGSDAPTMPLEKLGEVLYERVQTFFRLAGDELPYEGAEGGFQGDTYSTFEIITWELPIELPRDTVEAKLRTALADAIEADQLWCDYNPFNFDEDRALLIDWEQFCKLAKHDPDEVLKQRRRRRSWDRSLRPHEVLDEIIAFAQQIDLVCEISARTRLFHARAREANTHYTKAHELGPPPVPTREHRMSAPGEFMFYAADSAELAYAETRGELASIGTFVTERGLRVLNLAGLPPIPGVFGDALRAKIFALRFLHAFAALISRPVEAEQLEDYRPTQVFARYLRSKRINGKRLDGVVYRSATGVSGLNIAIFAGPSDIISNSSAGASGLLRFLASCDEEQAREKALREQVVVILSGLLQSRLAMTSDLPLFDASYTHYVAP